MSNIVVISDNIEVLKQLIENERLHQQLAERNEHLDVPAVEKGLEADQADYIPDYDPVTDTETDLVEDEDLRLIVQLRLEDETQLSPGFVMQKWVDTNVDPDDLEDYRERFIGAEYRLVAVYDEIVTEFDSVDQQDASAAEDEIGMLKAEILKLQSIIANYEAGDIAQ